MVETFLDIPDKSYQGRVLHNGTYQEFRPTAPLSRWVNCFWQLEINAGEYSYRSIPDNCVDWIFNVKDPQDSFVVAPYTLPQEFRVQGPINYYGVRFRPLGYQGFIKQPVGDWSLLDPVVHATDAVPEFSLVMMQDAIFAARSFQQRIHLSSQSLLRFLKIASLDKRLIQFIRYANSVDGYHSKSIDGIAKDLAISERQLRRLAGLHLGVSPKNYMRVARLQRFLHHLNQLSDQRAWADYYYDQPHFIREFKKLTGMTPKEFNSMSVLYN